MADEPEISVSALQYENVPPALKLQFDGLMQQSNALFDAGDLAGSKARLFEARELLKPYEMRRNTSDKDPPPPTGTSSAPPEGAHKVAEYRINSLAPSVELTNNYPVPYNITALANNDKNYSPNVRFRGTPAMRLNSSVTKNTGDEPANGRKGIVSGARGGVADPITSSPLVKINGSPAIRDGDLFGMDKAAPGGPANTIGEGRLKRDTAPREAPKDDRAWYEKGWDQFKAHSGTYQDGASVVGKIGEWYDNPSQIGADLRSAYDRLPSGSDLWQGAKNLGGRAVDLGGQVIADPGGSAAAAGGWAVDQGAAVVDGVQKIYAKDGVAGVAGAGLGVAGDILSPSRKGKLLTEAAEGAADLGKAARAERKAVEAGTPGLRVTEAAHEVPCFDQKGKYASKATEYDNQLKMQQDALNNMSPDDYLKARQAFDPSNRVPSVQEAARADWLASREYELFDSGMARDVAQAQAATEARSLAALHELDMIAGGSPTKIAGMGDAGVNSSIGSSWKSRVAGMDDHARAAQAAGKTRMNVELKRC